MSQFRWAYVGCGSIAKTTARSITRGDHTVAAVYSRTLAKAQAFADAHHAKAYRSFDELLSDGGFDAVYIATPHNSHADYAIRAMEAGKPVLCEKPVGVNLQEVDRMLETSRTTGVYFCEAMWTWFSDVALTVQKWIGERRIGDVKGVRMHYAFPGVLMPKTSRLRTPETAGGALLDIGVYPITYCYRLFGYPDRIDCKGTLRDGIDIAETVTLGYPGFNCTLELSLKKLRESCRIVGTAGEVRVPAFHMARYAALKTQAATERFTGKTDYLTEFTRVSQEIRAGRTDSAFVPQEATRDCMRIMDECRRQLGLQYPFEKDGTK